MATPDDRHELDSELPEGMLDEQAAFPQSKEAANPVVYKLVRVEGDGTLVPATEDEVMEVEYLLEEEKSCKSSKDVGGCSHSENMEDNLATKGLPGRDNDAKEENVVGFLKPKDAQRTLNAKLKFLDLLLERVKEEERLRMASGLPGHCLSYLPGRTAWNQPSRDHCQQSPYNVSNFQCSDAHIQKCMSSFRSVEEVAVKKLNIEALDPTKNNNTEKTDGRFLATQAAVIPKLDPDPVRSEICLDNLTIRELHEAFRTTFGRETSVKDKQWLKRRISVGLRDVADNNFVAENNDSSIKKQEEISSRHGNCLPAELPVSYSANIQVSKRKFTSDGTAELVVKKQPHERMSSLIPLMDIVANTECGLSNDEAHTRGEIAGKRVRKPTRRYIEELSEVEPRVNNGRLVPATRDSDDDNSSQMSYFRSSYWNEFEGMESVSRHDSLGGSGIEVPFVSRVRRGRPRKNFNALLKYNPSGRAAKLVKKALCVRTVRSDGDNAEIKQKLSGSNQQQPLCGIQENEEQVLPIGTDSPCISEPLDFHSLDEISNEHIATVPTAKGGIRRKHHRPWTLRDVMKLVEGVSQCGIGKWSDIKRAAFSSSGYRTSVDLKDKWRNLLRASCSQLQTSKEAMNRRKHASVPIPAPILIRVRELAAMQSSQAVSIPSRSISRSGRTVHKKQQV